jgi:hypothetical protein
MYKHYFVFNTVEYHVSWRKAMPKRLQSIINQVKGFIKCWAQACFKQVYSIIAPLALYSLKATKIYFHAKYQVSSSKNEWVMAILLIAH